MIQSLVEGRGGRGTTLSRRRDAQRRAGGGRLGPQVRLLLGSGTKSVELITTVFYPDRDRRLGGGRNGTSGRDGREGALSSGDSRNGPRSARPAWMDDEPSTASSSTPAWMDAPVSGTGLAFGATPAAGGGDGGDGGMDSIQAFKAQMKEEERRRNAPTASRRDSDRRDSDDADDGRPSKANGLTIDLPTNSHPLAVAVDGSSPVPPSSNHDGASGGVLRPAVDGLNDDFTIPASNESRPSVFENLGLRNGASRPPAEKVRGGRGGGGGEGQGRSSRFAKFFDAGKPQTPSAAAPPPQPHSIFSELMGGMAKPKSGPEPSREDQESMARLLGMLQISGVRPIPLLNLGLVDADLP